MPTNPNDNTVVLSGWGYVHDEETFGDVLLFSSRLEGAETAADYAWFGIDEEVDPWLAMLEFAYATNDCWDDMVFVRVKLYTT